MVSQGFRDGFLLNVTPQLCIGANPCVNSVGADNPAITVIWLLKLTSLCFNMN
jgi:hypothetical protein